MGRRRVARGGWYQRVYAALLRHFQEGYEPKVAERKRALFGELTGTVLDIGAGTGANLPYVGKDVEWLGIDPNPFLPPYVRRAAASSGVSATFGAAVAEELPVADASVDAVISTLVLCSVADPAVALREIVRVLKPGGRFVFIEHVAAPPGTSTRRRQTWIRHLWKLLGDGCHPDRETWWWIEAAGFADVHYERFHLQLPIVGPHIAGVAMKGNEQTNSTVSVR